MAGPWCSSLSTLLLLLTANLAWSAHNGRSRRLCEQSHTHKHTPSCSSQQGEGQEESTHSGQASWDPEDLRCLRPPGDEYLLCSLQERCTTPLPGSKTPQSTTPSFFSPFTSSLLYLQSYAFSSFFIKSRNKLSFFDKHALQTITQGRYSVMTGGERAKLLGQTNRSATQTEKIQQACKMLAVRVEGEADRFLGN